MAFKKGHKKIGGKVAGVQNKATRDIKEAYKNLLEMNLDNMTGWLERVAIKEPHRAFKIMMDLSEYVIPRLARVEHTGDKDNPVSVEYDLTKLSTESIKELINAGIIEKPT